MRFLKQQEKSQLKAALFFIFLILSGCLPKNQGLPLNPVSAPNQATPDRWQRMTEIAAGFTPTPLPSATPWPITTSTAAPVVLPTFAAGVNPLTGLRVDDPQLLERRPVMIKVSNWPRLGRPHAGLSSADIVFEYFIGSQMNRFLAIYYGKDAERVWPIRSGRLVDAKLTDLYQGVLAYGNADPSVDKILIEVLGERALGFGFIPCPGLCGESTHSATGVYANSAAITKYVDEVGISNQKPDLTGMYFQEKIDSWDDLGEMLSFMYADFSVMQWHYNPISERYDLWQDFETEEGKIILQPTTDENTDQALSFDNILILFANYIEYTPSLHDIDLLVGNYKQAAILFRDGKLIYGTWRTPSDKKPLVFETLDGSPMPLKPGQSWIVLAGNHTVTERVQQGEWDFLFDLP